MLPAPALIGLFEFFGSAQPVFPLPLQMTRHQPILRFDGIELTTRPFCFIPRSFQTQLPLMA